MRTFVLSAAMLALAACSQETDTTPDTTAEVETTAPAPTTPPASTAMIESDARTRIEAAGYTNVTGLTQNADGTWTATATRDGQTTSVIVDDMGVRVVTTTP